MRTIRIVQPATSRRVSMIFSKLQPSPRVRLPPPLVAGARAHRSAKIDTMCGYPDRFVSQILDEDRIKIALLALSDELAKKIADDTQLRIIYGWGSGLHSALTHIPMSVRADHLSKFIHDSVRQEIIIPGDSDFIMEVPKDRVTFVFCHEGHIHSSGNDYLFETDLWMSDALSDIPLVPDCNGTGLIAMKRAEQSASCNPLPAAEFR